MPYIPTRRRLDADINPTTPGELSFTIAAIVDDYLLAPGELDYALLNEVIGVLECLKLEIFRRIVAPYEKRKRKENGEVFLAAP